MKIKPAYEGGKPTRDNFLVFGKPQIKSSEIREVVDSMKSGWLGTGPKVARFEENLNGYLGSKYLLAVNSCTAGLHLALLACGIGKGDEVITTAMTFAATSNVIIHVGAIPIFVDVDLPSMNIDIEQIEKSITPKTKAIIPVHMAGRPCEMDKIMNIAKRHKLKVIEDAAHAFGASYKNKKIGTIGDITVFSFYATKNLATGEGGAIATNSKRYADFMKINALHGMSRDAWKKYSKEGFKHYQTLFPGFKYNMMDLQAAIRLHQLERFDVNQKKRKKIWSLYQKAFSDLPVTLPMEPDDKMVHAYHLYTILLNLEKLTVDRDHVLSAIQAENIGVGVHFLAVPTHPYYKKRFKFKKGDFPKSEFISERTISIPFSAQLSDSDVKDVIRGVRKVILYYTKSTSN